MNCLLWVSWTVYNSQHFVSEMYSVQLPAFCEWPGQWTMNCLLWVSWTVYNELPFVSELDSGQWTSFCEWAGQWTMNCWTVTCLLWEKYLSSDLYYCWIMTCLLDYDLPAGLWPVCWIMTCLLDYDLSAGLLPVFWIMTCLLNNDLPDVRERIQVLCEDPDSLVLSPGHGHHRLQIFKYSYSTVHAVQNFP